MADSSAVVAICGCPPTRDLEKGVLQAMYRHREGDYTNIMRFATKRVWTITRPDRTPDIIARAFKEATTGRPGPVLVELPIDLQPLAVDVPGIPEPLSRRPVGRVRGDAGQIGRAADLLMTARRPLILAGGGVVLSEASGELVRLAEALNAPVITTMMGKGAISESHRLFAGYAGWSGTRPGNEMAKDCDVLLAVGTRFADLTCSCYEPGVTYSMPPTRLIHVDLDPLEIGKNYPVEIGIVGDARAVLADLVEAVPTREESTRTPWLGKLEELQEAWDEELGPDRTSDASPVTMPRFLADLRDFLDDDAIVLGEAGWAQIFLFQQFPVYSPRTHLSSGGFSTMGFGVPGSIGAKLAYPDRQVVACVGDGGFLMALHEIATAVQYNISIVVCVLNNLGWLCIRDLQNIQCAPPGESVDRSVATMFVYDDTRGVSKSEPYDIDFAAFAQSFRAFGATVRTPEEIGPALEAAFASGRPAVINVYVAPEVVPPMPGFWELPTPEYLVRELEGRE
jgi:acetolactate synthase-1/2/3 large subunit